MLGNFNIPSVDHLREGVDYRVIDWDFAANQPAASIPHTPGEACPEGTRMIFGRCRKVKKDGDWDTSGDTEQEQQAKKAAKEEGSAYENNKAFTVGGKKFGWAMKNGVPVVVAWGSVATEKKVGPKQPASQPKSGSSGTSSPVPKGDSGRIKGLKAALDKQTTPDGRKAIEDLIREQGGVV